MTVTSYEARVKEAVRQASVRGVVVGANRIRTAAIDRILTGIKSGREYRRRGVTHRASAPSEAFASDTGNAVNLIKMIPDPATVSATVNFGAAYAPYLEFGTETMEPRPVARPAAEQERENVVGDVRAEIEAALRGLS